MKVYGPYTRKDGRKHVIIVDGSVKKTVSYPKFLIEKHLGRKLKENETVDHIDRDFTNDSLDNLRIVEKSKHSSDDALRVRLTKITCVLCGKSCYKKCGVLHGNSKQNKAGPFCSKKCVGVYGSFVQNGGKKLENQPKFPKSERTYFKRAK